MRRIVFVILVYFFSSVIVLSQTQGKYTIKGKVSDATTKEWMAGAPVGVEEIPQGGTFTDESGNYVLSLSPGDYTLVFDFLGYNIQKIKVTVNKNQTVNVDLEPKAVSLTEVEITARRRDENIKSVQMGVDKLEIKDVNKIPVLFGERDIMKIIQLLPGVQAAGEGNTGFYVRGGSNDQNLVLLDNATVYNPSHLFGFFSTFNSDAVEDITIYKGSMPPHFGGRLSSTLDVSMRDGDMKKYGVSGGIGLISSRIAVEGPIQKDKTSFIVAARRTYADALAQAAGVGAVKGSTLYFYDLNAKLSYVLSDRDKLTFTAYNGKDVLGLQDITRIDWGNTAASLKWNHRYSEKMASVTTASLTRYLYNIEINFVDKLNIASRINDYNINHEFNFYPNDRNIIKVGVNSIYHQVAPGRVSSADPSRLDVTSFADRYSWDNSVFINNNMKVTDRLNVDYGLRLTAFSVLGGGDFFTYDKDRNIIDTITTKRGEFVKTYLNLEPRLGLVYQLDRKSSLKAAYTRTTQNIQLLAVTNMESSPTDRWISSNNYIKPQIADQVALGYFRNFDNNRFEFSAEVYYRDLKNQVDFIDGATQIYQKDNVEPYLLFGKGRAYGLELFLKKKYGRFNGWIGYTLSRSERKIDGINNNEWYVANQHRASDISVVGVYDLTKKWSLSATWIYTSGAPVTLPSGKYEVDGNTIYYYEGRNTYRAPAYHRLDLGAVCVLKNTKKYYSELSFGLYNAYSRKNAYMFGFRQNEEDRTKSESYMIYLFGAIPSISWNFKF